MLVYSDPTQPVFCIRIYSSPVILEQYYIITDLFTYLIIYLLHGAESFLKS